jgi:transposase InsO family protein
MNTDPATKIARQRLSVLELAQSLNNVSEACRRRGISRTIFYEYKNRFEQHGLEGLKDLPPIPKSHPFTTPPELVEQILELSLQQPARGCNWISDQLKLRGIHISYPTVQNILNKEKMGTRYERWLRLEQVAAEQDFVPTKEQMTFLEKENPIWKERNHLESSQPGELLCQDTSALTRMDGVGRVYVHATVDSFSSYAFAFLYPSKQPEAAVSVVHNDVLPFYSSLELIVGAMLTDNGSEFCGTPEHPYEIYLSLCDIEHRRTKIRSPHTNGFVERFIRTLKEEFFETMRRQKAWGTLDDLQADLDEWLMYYNYERPHQGYRNMGRRPYDTIKNYLESVKEET